ncbi:hypothetical protein ABG79_01169 [Caloramator mitchellensis]|uniref:PASTA domain protein n=1 Tax=Caloramator mitchellensis TaxID=908809 RepID=A0A0R3JTV3_CALMK|nr:hypothetical protein [Caloramator mitchellensis]KRQ86979.1 hypothetical protein ABG79_01169 [Caloramator mitchellensis]
MDLQKYLGYVLEDVIPFFEEQNIQYEIYELLTPKGEKIGEEKRIVKIEEGQTVKIFISYF